MLLGKEIYLFFYQYGIYGILGIILSTSLIGCIIYHVLKKIKQQKIDTYDKLTEKLYPNTKIRDVMDAVITIFLLISFYIMVAGFSAYFSQELGFPNRIGTIIILLLCYCTFMGNIKSIIKVNTFLIPLLIFFMIVLVLKNPPVFTQLYQNNNNHTIGNSLYRAILYGSYNTILLVPILVSLKDNVKNIKQIKKIAILCTIILSILAIIIFGLLSNININIQILELPTIYVAGQMGKGYQYAYGIVILVAIYTSAVSGGYGILQKYSQKPKKYRTIAILMCITALFVSHLGFSALINLMYPIFGLLGTIQILLILKNRT